MNKFISTAAFLAASTALASAGTVMFDSVLSSWTSGVHDSDADQSMWDAVIGKTATTVAGNALINAAGYGTATDYSGLDKTVSLSNLYSSDSSISAGSFVLNSYSVVGRTDTAGRPTGAVVAVYDSSNLLIGFGGTVTYTSASTSSSYGSATFSDIFAVSGGTSTADALVLDYTSSYTFKILTSERGTATGDATETVNGTAYYQTVQDSATYKFGYGEFKMQWSSNTGGKLDGLNNSGDYKKPVVRLSVTTIPEPSAFGLLAGAGALALVAARRRRRAK